MKRAVGILTASLALAGAAMASPAMAQDAAAPSKAVDPRIMTRVFDENAVVTLRGKVKVQTTIKFAEDERIENVAIGDSASWQVQPNKAQSILFVKPLSPSAETNLTVVTNKRTYLFDLVASSRNAPLYVMQFRYPELERAKEEARLAAEAAAQQERASAAELRAATDPYAVQDPDRINWQWASAGEATLLPLQVYDNGDAVFLTWGPDSTVPAILVLNEQGEEGPVNSTTRGDTVVLDRVPPQIILRSGQETATLTNLGPSKDTARNTSGRETEVRGS